MALQALESKTVRPLISMIIIFSHWFSFYFFLSLEKKYFVKYMYTAPTTTTNKHTKHQLTHMHIHYTAPITNTNTTHSIHHKHYTLYTTQHPPAHSRCMRLDTLISCRASMVSVWNILMTGEWRYDTQTPTPHRATWEMARWVDSCTLL